MNVSKNLYDCGFLLSLYFTCLRSCQLDRHTLSSVQLYCKCLMMAAVRKPMFESLLNLRAAGHT
jgi:hypothetical protein